MNGSNRNDSGSDSNSDNDGGGGVGDCSGGNNKMLGILFNEPVKSTDIHVANACTVSPSDMYICERLTPTHFGPVSFTQLFVPVSSSFFPLHAHFM